MEARVYTTQVVNGTYEIVDGGMTVAIPDALEGAFEAHMKAYLPPWALLSDEARERRRHEACADWIAEHA